MKKHGPNPTKKTRKSTTETKHIRTNIHLPNSKTKKK